MAVNIMKLKMRGVLSQYSEDMRSAIGSKMDWPGNLKVPNMKDVKESESEEE